MKVFFTLPLFLFLAVSCGSDETVTSEYETVDTTAVPPDTILFRQGHINDGMYEDFSIASENGDTVTPATREIHVVPQILEDSGYDSASVCEFMFGIVSMNFDLYYQGFDAFDGTIKFFYDANRTKLVTAYHMVNNVPEGPLQVFTPDGELVISRLYKDGYCVSSIVDLYAIDWTFNPLNSGLEITKFADYKSTDQDGNSLIHLGESMYPSDEVGPEDLSTNSLYSMIQKPVFENVFTVNGQPYTGTLMGYRCFYILRPDEPLAPYFELVFLDGKLTDTIRLYDEYGDLTLEEKFENGVLTETIYELDYSEMDGMAKPVIYLYPERDMLVNVQLNLHGEMTHSYPKYPEGGWNVLAKQNGTLYDHTGKEFYALFWEGVSPKNYTYENGFVIAGNETEKFLENSLEILGLTRREANEFIMYWLPQMENNAYNLIHFSTSEYEEIAELKITPAPESLIRVMMVWSPLETEIEIPQQNLYDMRVEREGFTVVEWGGKKQAYNAEF